MEAGKGIVLVAQKSAAKDDPGKDDLYDIGSMANILQMLKLPDGTVKCWWKARSVSMCCAYLTQTGHFDAEVEIVPAEDGTDSESEAMRAR